MAFKIIKQEKSQWCWAAVAQSADHFLHTTTNSTQCSIAARVLSVANCCTDPKKEESCNCQASLEKALRAIQQPYTKHFQALGFGDIQAEIDAGLPVCARVEWEGGGGHFVVISGYDQINDRYYVFVKDPWNRSWKWHYEDFRDAYLGVGKWTQTFCMHN